MKELINVYQEKGEEFLDDLFNDYLIVTEKLAGSSFSFQKKDNTLQFFKGDSKKPISLIDRTLMVYYEKPIQFISDIPAEILTTVPNNWRFCFQYFVNNKPTNIEYERLPHNSLVLTHIIVKDERGKTAKIIEDPRVLKDWATKFHVTPMQPIFYGKLNSGQKDKIKDFLSVPIEDQMEMFGTSSFAKYLIKGVLNPSLNSTMLHNDLLNPIDSIVFKFYGDDGQSTVSAKMIDPYTSSLMKEKEPVDLRRAPADINEIVLLDILAFLEERGLRRHDVLSATTEERYLELVSALFNDYVERRGEDLQKLDFQKAEFSKAEEFGLNLDLIKNEKTKKILGQSDVLKDLFKIMLGSLRKKRNPKKEGAIMTTSVIEDFNKMIDKIQKIAQEETDGEFKTFEDYLKLKQMNEELYIGNDLEEMVKEEVYLNFKEFTNISKVNINEALKVPHKEQGKKKVNIFVGRFQPFTLGHAKVFKQLHDLNGLPVHVLLVRGGKPDPEKRPFDEDAQQRMFQAMQKQYPFLSGSTVIPNGAIDTIYSALRPAYEPAIWGYGTDRKKAYGGMIDKQSYRDQLGVLPDFKGHEIKRGDEDISASKVRQALKVDDRKTFERMVPKSLHDFYEELQNILVPIEESEELNEGKDPKKTTKAKQPFWDSYFANVDIAQVPVNTKKDELIRAPFGPNDGKTVEDNIKKMFKGANVEIDDIEFNDLGVLRRTGLGSKDYPTYRVISKDGDEYFITNNIVELEGGGVSEINKKVTNPNGMGIADRDFYNAESVVNAIENNLKTLPWSNDTKEYLLGLAKAVKNNANSSFTNMQAFWEAGEVSETISLDGYINPDFEIDERSRRNIINDYGEVLDGIYLLKTIKKLKSPLVYPESGNEALADIYIEPWSISSKAKKAGGKPSINALVDVVKEHSVLNQDLEPENIREKELYDFLLLLDSIKGKKSKLPTVESYIALSNWLIDKKLMKNSGFELFLKKSKLNKDLIDRNDIMQWLIDFATTNPAGFNKWIEEYRKATGVRPTTKMIAPTFLKNPEGDGFYYPFAVQATKVLNQYYKEALRALINKLLVVKQMYFGIDIKKNEISIRSTSSNTIKAADFKARGSAKNFNAGLGYEMK